MKKQGLLLIVMCLTLMSSAQTKFEIAGGVKGKRYSLKRDWGNLNYEVFGKGDPLLILHGNGGSVKGRYQMIPELLEHHQVIGVDSRCHGLSDCPEGDLGYFEMADDIMGLMESLGHEKYSIWGHSDGGILGLIIGYKMTDRVDRMILSGANARVSGLKTELVEMMKQYEQIPDPRTRTHTLLMLNQEEIPMDSIRKVNVPVMLMVGDRDAVSLEHTIEIFKALPMSNLCVLPATSHFVTSEKPNHLVYWLREFKKPFSAPSTVEIANQMAKSMFGN